jgi:hypothetical protein
MRVHSLAAIIVALLSAGTSLTAHVQQLQKSQTRTASPASPPSQELKRARGELQLLLTDMRTTTNAEKPDINVVRSLVQEIDRVASKIESELRKAEAR